MKESRTKYISRCCADKNPLITKKAEGVINFHRGLGFVHSWDLERKGEPGSRAASAVLE